MSVTGKPSSVTMCVNGKGNLQEATRLAYWLANVQAQMLARVIPGPSPLHSTLAGMVHTLLQEGDVESARLKAAHLPHVDRRMPDESVFGSLGEIAAASFSSFDRNCIRLHELLDTQPPQ